MLSGQGVTLDQLELGAIGEARAKQPGQVPVDLDGDHPPGGPNTGQQFFGEGAGAGPNLDNVIAADELAGIGDEPDQVLVDHEILPEPVPRLGADLGKQGEDFMLRLGHGKRIPNGGPLATWSRLFKIPAMKSYEVIRQAVEERGVKAIAAALKLSPALVYKWCEPPSDAGDPDQSGTRNPLDRARELYLLTRDIRLVRWLCNEAGGFFVPNPETPSIDMDRAIYTHTRGMVRDFSELLDAVTESVEDDNSIDLEEADEIRQKWEDLKSAVERFVIACERGHYHVKRK